jgi:hypothetical protein
MHGQVSPVAIAPVVVLTNFEQSKTHPAVGVATHLKFSTQAHAPSGEGSAVVAFAKLLQLRMQAPLLQR